MKEISFILFFTPFFCFSQEHIKTSNYFTDLTIEEKRIIVFKGTEEPNSGHYNKHFQEGVYICKACNNPLFNSNWTNIFSRTYAQSISGIPVNTSFNIDTKQFHLCWKPNYNIKEPSVIYYNPKQYKNIKNRIKIQNSISIKINDSYIYLYNNKNIVNIQCFQIL